MTSVSQATHPSRNIALLGGDGIGPELMEAIRPLLTEAFPNWSLHDAAIGWSRWCSDGNPVPQETWEVLDRCDAALFAAITSKPAADAERELAPELRGKGVRYVSPILQLRKRLDLYANVRPVQDFVVVRENTEGLYAHDFTMAYLPDGDEGSADSFDLWKRIKDDTTVAATVTTEEASMNPTAKALGDVAVALRVTTTFGWERLLRTGAKLALERAENRARTTDSHSPAARNPNAAASDVEAPGVVTPRVTIADKPNVLRDSGDVIARAVERVTAEFPQVTFEFANADIVAMHMVTEPERFDVIVAENLIGDILSDLGAGLMGGMGLPASANYGDSFAIFEPVHGSAPDIAGQGIANPTALLLSAAMCADYVGDDGTPLRDAVHAAMASNPTRDLGGTATTVEFVDTVRSQLNRLE